MVILLWAVFDLTLNYTLLQKDSKIINYYCSIYLNLFKADTLYLADTSVSPKGLHLIWVSLFFIIKS